MMFETRRIPVHSLHRFFNGFSIQRMRKILIGLENWFREQQGSLKKVNPRRPLYSCSRIRVAEGSPKRKEIKQIETSEEKRSKNHQNQISKR